MSTAGVIGRNTAVQVAGEVLGKAASLAFFVVMARRLGEDGFGTFTFALSLALLLTGIAGLGVDGIATRELARDRERLGQLLWNALALKLGFGAIAVGLAVGIAIAGDYPPSVPVAVAILAAAALVELLAKSLYATFQGLDDMRPPAISQLIQRLAVAGLGIPALLSGYGVVAVAVIYLTGALLAAAWAGRTLARRSVQAGLALSRSAAGRLLREALPLGLTGVLSVVLFRVDTTLLSLMKGNAAVGVYGAAYRLLESTLFLSYAFVAAMLPTLARLGRRTTPPVAEAYESATKVVVSALAPVGTTFALFAEPIVHVLYGSGYSEAVTALRLLGGAAALYGISYLSSYVLIAQGAQRAIPWITGGVMVQNVALNLIAIPRWSYDAAAAATTISEATLAAGLMIAALRVTGRISLARIATGPVAGCLAMGAIAIGIGPTVPGLLAAAVAYPLVLALVERRLFPADIGLLVDVLRRRRALT